jgi:antitoxin component YwqK of YwqJK toxin-antitoxin module
MKNNLLTTTLLLAATALFAQDNGNKVFYLDSLHNITTEKKFFYTRTVEDYNSKKDLYVVTDYYHPSGKINMSATSKNKDVLRLEGTRTDYYENGNKKQESNYIDN